MTLILCGHQGVGKSTIGDMLAKQRKQPWIDTDTLLKKALGCPLEKRLSEVHQRIGDQAFRELECQTILCLKPTEPCVISIGGGALTHDDTIAHLKELGHIVYLKRPLEETKKHLLNNPVYWVQAMTDSGELDSWLRARDYRYTHAAHVSIDVDGLSLDECVNRCFNYGESHGQ